jgi:hypothetical protein
MRPKRLVSKLRQFSAAMVFTLAVHAAVPPVSFNAPRSFPVPYGTVSAEGDFNNDGKLDLVGVQGTGTSSTAFILVGNGDGTFKPSRNIGALPNTGDAAVAGDFNGDGKLDYLVAYPDGAAVLLGNGDGTFQPAKTTPMPGGYPVSITLADFNGDGKLDLAFVDAGGVVWAMLGNGDGTFQPGISAPLAADALVLAAGDFNGDGKPDLAVATAATGGETGTQGALWILYGNGNGTFQEQEGFELFVGAEPSAIAVGDLNGDGKPDVVVTNYGDNTLSILMGTGHGVEGSADIAVGLGPLSIAIGDFNGDGRPDLAIGNQTTISILLATSKGFAAAVSYAPGEAILAGDFNGDGNLDLALIDTETILLGNGHGEFQHLNTFAAGNGPLSVAVADFNGDGILDLAVADSVDTVSILLGKGSGTFQAPVAYGPGTRPTYIAAGDFNGDGKPDLAVVVNGGVSILVGNGDGTFSPGQSGILLTGPLALADYNGDGKLDLAGIVSGDNIGIALGNGDGTFQAVKRVLAGAAPKYLATGDFNGDGKPDLAVIVRPNGQTAVVSILLGNGNGTFAPPVRYAAGVGPLALAVGDFNGDGRTDLAVANNSTANVGSVAILLNNGDGTFGKLVAYPAGVDPTSLVVADFNGDGIPDIAASGRSVSVLLGKGSGAFNPGVGYSPGGPVATGDFNGDGKPDIVSAGLSGSAAVLLNTSK